MSNISPAALTLFSPKSCDLMRPKLSSSMTAKAITKGQSATLIAMISLRMQGNAVTKPNNANEIRVAKPHFAGKRASLTLTRRSSYRSIMFTKAPSCVAKRSARRTQSSFAQPLLEYSSTISSFSSLRKFLTSYNSRSSSVATQEISALAETQSQAAISIAPATMVATAIAKSECVDIPLETPLSSMMVVLTVPSTPPQMIDLSNYPASLCFYSCLDQRRMLWPDRYDSSMCCCIKIDEWEGLLKYQLWKKWKQR